MSKDARAKRGISIALHKDWRNRVKTWEEVDEQIMILELSKNGQNIVIVGVYAPSEDADQQIKDEFYNKLRNTLSDVKDDKEIYLVGDFNGRVGRDENNSVVGRYGEEPLNNNGTRLRDLCKDMSLRIMNGFFQHKNVHKFTWVQPTKGLQSLIDYVIQRQNSKLQTTDVRAYRGPECGTDHYLVVAKVIVHYRKICGRKRNQERKTEEETKLEICKYNLESLRHESVKFLYKLRLAHQLQSVQTEHVNAANIYQQVKQCIHQAARESLGQKEEGNRNNPEWWSEELRGMVECKKKAYQTWLSTQSNNDRLIYVQYNRNVKREVIRNKNESWERKCEEVDRCMGGSKVSQAWNTIKNLKNGGKQRNKVQLIGLKEWTEHYKALLTENRPKFKEVEVCIDEVDNSEVQEITVREIKDALNNTKNGKASGPGNIPIELVKYSPDILIQILMLMFNKCLINGDNIPEDWNIAYITPIFKNGNK